MNMKKRLVAIAALAGNMTMAITAQQNPLMAARDLYASARYDEALAVLNGLRPPATGSDLKSVEQYRSLCLLALGRGTEAEAAIAAVITADPAYHPSEVEASPRVRAAFTEVRQKLLPDIARSRYAEAKATFDRKEYQQARDQFQGLLGLIDDPEMGGRLGDLRVLVTGFIDLTAAAAAPAPKPAAKAEEPAPAPPPPSPSSVAAATPASSHASAPRIFGGDDQNVKAPVIIKQEVPRVPTSVTASTRNRGLLEVVIDEQGRVTSATVRISMHPVYDALLLTAAREWKYQPATLGGKPVKFRKMIQISISRT
jgi:TonB family protein